MRQDKYSCSVLWNNFHFPIQKEKLNHKFDANILYTAHWHYFNFTSTLEGCVYAHAVKALQWRICDNSFYLKKRKISTTIVQQFVSSISEIQLFNLSKFIWTLNILFIHIPKGKMWNFINFHSLAEQNIFSLREWRIVISYANIALQ